MKHLLLCAAASLVLASCSPGTESPRRAVSLAACRLPGVESEARCGKYEVWENRATRTGRRIPINIAVIPARRRTREPDPIFVLAGGPGQGAVALAAQVMPLFAKLNDTRDVVLVDQRGTGESHPLDCEDDDAPVQSLFEDTLPGDVVRKCLAGLDADPRQYITSIAVEDFDEVRAALGYEKLDLWAGSYGTRSALEYVRRHGEHVRTMVLDGVAPSTMKMPLSFVSDGETALRRLVAGCEAQAPCQHAYPELGSTIHRLRERFARRPQRVAIEDPRTGEEQTVRVTQNVFLSGLFRPLYVAELASLLPYGVAAASRGDFNPLLAQNLEFADDVSENLSVGMHLSVICAEDIPRIHAPDLAAAEHRSSAGRWSTTTLRACRIWPRGKVPADYYDPVRSDVHALLLSGGIDPATPPHHAKQVAATLPNAVSFVAPQVGHGVSQQGCAPRLIESFVRQGSARSIDGSCLEKIPRPLFVLPLGPSS